MDRMDHHPRKKGRTILCPGTIGKLGSASRVHALSSDRKDMEHSSSCWDKYMTPLTRAMDPVWFPYHILYSCVETQQLCGYSSLSRTHTSLMNLFSSSASSNSSSTTVGFMLLKGTQMSGT